MSLPLHHDVDNELREHYVQCMDEACAREQAYMNACVADRNDPNLPALLEDYNRAKALSADALSAWQMYRQTAPAEGGLVTFLNRILASIVPNRSSDAHHCRQDRDRDSSTPKKTN
ncbi:Uncharacterized protein PBTT_07482 [Plasmodiophora brassicae]|uniref:Uncharacterized protein n=1 Tax=Plasmodiophora brassicae TaxID=37360 RepID=A0A3P3YGS3_PLABS|nr:unnamed protein product [Plasmodiophora brassicae]